MIGVNPDDPTTHLAFHQNQGNDLEAPPLCIMKGVCKGLRHLYSDCPNIVSEDTYYAYWKGWAFQQELSQQAQWDNHVSRANVNPTGAGSATLYTVCSD